MTRPLCFVGSFFLLFLLIGCAAKPTVQGVNPLSSPLTKVSRLADSGVKPDSKIAVQGTMVEKCPVSGCWLRLKDTSGIVKVDLRAMGFSAAEIPVGTTLTIIGTKEAAGGETSIIASGLRY